MTKINILDTEWKVYLYDDYDFSEKFNDNVNAAFTLPSERVIVFNQDELTIQVVKHELVHAYYASLPIDSMDMTLNNQEELLAELFATHGDRLLRTARWLYKALKEGDID